MSRIYALRTISPDSAVKCTSAVCAGHKIVFMERFDDRPHEHHGQLVDKAREIAPDFIIFIGAPGEWHRLPIPNPDVLRALDAVAPMVHICNDAGDDPIWDLQEMYFREKCFTLQVAIDGSHASPIASFPNGMALLTPIDPAPFAPKPWAEKRIRFGMVGGEGHTERGMYREEMCRRGMLSFVKNEDARPYEEVARIMSDTQITWNHPMTGSGNYRHVKGRVVEAGYASSCLMDHIASPTRDWFEPGANYLAYTSVEDIERILRDTPDSMFREIASHHCKAIYRDHHPVAFWNKVLTKMTELRHVGT